MAVAWETSSERLALSQPYLIGGGLVQLACAIGFRVFRIDRMSAFTALETTFDAEPGKTARDFLKQDAEKKQATLRTRMKEDIA
jgi:hypothetical protein